VVNCRSSSECSFSRQVDHVAALFLEASPQSQWEEERRNKNKVIWLVGKMFQNLTKKSASSLKYLLSSSVSSSSCTSSRRSYGHPLLCQDFQHSQLCPNTVVGPHQDQLESVPPPGYFKRQVGVAAASARGEKGLVSCGSDPQQSHLFRCVQFNSILTGVAAEDKCTHAAMVGLILPSIV